MKRILLIFCTLLSAVFCSSAKVGHYSVKVVKEYPHDTQAYTQGFFFQGSQLYESTGLKGRSSFRRLSLESAEPEFKMDFNKKYFVEGSVMLGDNLYILTWQNKVLFLYDAKSLEYKSSYSYPREGWGLTTDGKSLIASDGTSYLYFLSPELKLERSLNVTLNGKALKYLNELEWVEGKIWANVYMTDFIVIINPKDGKVEALVDCSGLLPESLRTKDTDVLNGIAVDSQGRIFLTGKNWPRIYEVRLVEEKD